MNAPDRIASAFEPALDSIEWANSAIEEFDTLARDFFHSDCAEFFTEFDPKTGENVFKVRIVKPLPVALRRKATEALVTTRHAFDQATFAARNLTSGFSTKGVNYPWAQNPVDMKRLLKARGIDERLWDVFAAQEPYPRGNGHSGGNNVVRALATIANNKHTVGLAIDLLPTITRFEEVIFVEAEEVNLGLCVWDGVKQEGELARVKGKAIYKNPNVFFNVSLDDPKLMNGLGAVRTLKVFLASGLRATQCLWARCEALKL